MTAREYAYYEALSSLPEREKTDPKKVRDACGCSLRTAYRLVHVYMQYRRNVQKVSK